MQIVKLSSKNQITIPADLISALKMAPRGKFILEAGTNTLTLKPVKTSIVAQTADSLTPYIALSKRKVPFATILSQTKRKVAKYLVGKT